MDIGPTVQAVWKLESARIIAGLTRIVRDVGRAEEFAQDALVSALEQWPRTGVPDNPGAWLMTAAASGHRRCPPGRAPGTSVNRSRASSNGSAAGAGATTSCV
jgi:hypothetical protein